MDFLLAVTIAKFASFAVAGLSTIWGLISKTTVEADGRKRLTPAGYVAIALIATSSIVGALSYGFESVWKDQQERRLAEEGFQRQVEQDRAEQARQRHADQIERRRQNELIRVQLALLDQRSLTLLLRAEERARASSLAARLNAETRGSIARTGKVLSQIDRTLNPIENLKVSVRWRLEPPLPAGSAFLEQHVRLGDAYARQGIAALSGTGMSGGSLAGAKYVGGNIDEIAPSEFILKALIMNAGVLVTILPGSTEMEDIDQVIDFKCGGITSGYMGVGLEFSAQNSSLQYYFDVATHSFLIPFMAAPDPAEVRKTSEMTAVNDLYGAIIVICRSAGGGPLFLGPDDEKVAARLRLEAVTLDASGRTFNASWQIKSRTTPDGTTGYYSKL